MTEAVVECDGSPTCGLVGHILDGRGHETDMSCCGMCTELTIREALGIYGRGSTEHHAAIKHAASCRLMH